MPMDKLLKQVQALSPAGKELYRKYREKAWPVEDSLIKTMARLRRREQQRKYRLINRVRYKMRYENGYLYTSQLLYDYLTEKERSILRELAKFNIHIQITL